MRIVFHVSISARGPHRSDTGRRLAGRNRMNQPGNFSIVHTHSGPEAWWVLEGEQCLETTKAAIRRHAGEGAIVEEGETMGMVGIGTGPRRSLVLVLHDSHRPPATVVDDPPTLKNCR